MRDALPDIAPMFDTFKGRTDITVQDIESYLLDLGRPLNVFEHEVFKICMEIKEDGAEPKNRIYAESVVQRLADYMNRRNQVLLEAETGLQNLQQTVLPEGMNEEQMPKIDEFALTEKVKGGMSELLSAYHKAPYTSDKLILLGGAAVSVFILLKVGKWFFTSPNRLVGLARTGAGLGIAALALNRAYTLVRGGPLYSFDNVLTPEGRKNQPIGYNQKEWSEKMYKEQLDEAVDELKKKNVDDAFIQRMLGVGGTPNDVKYVKGITNFGALSVREFLDMYERSRDAKQVSDVDWPNHPCADSEQFTQNNLRPTERFAIMEEMAKTLELIDAGGGVKSDIQEDELNESVFVKILNRP